MERDGGQTKHLGGNSRGRLNAMETTIEEFMAELRGVHQELQEINKILGRRT